MDPVTAIANTMTAFMTLATKVWDATPVPQQQQAASDWATLVHNIGAAILKLQDKISAKL